MTPSDYIVSLRLSTIFYSLRLTVVNPGLMVIPNTQFLSTVRTSILRTFPAFFAIASFALPLPVLAQTDPSPELEPAPPEDPNYIIPPRIAPEAEINPFTKTIRLNDTAITHLTEWEFLSGYTFGDRIESDPFLNGLVKLDSQVVESLTRNNIYIVDQTGRYFQLRTVPNERVVTTTTTQPQTAIGLELQMTFTGACIFDESASDRQCTFTPGLVIDRDSIDERFLVPTRVFQTSQVGDTVTPESFAAIQQPGFQRGANGQDIGVDFYFPNIGAFPGNSQSLQTEIEREEDLDNTIAGTGYQVRQVVKANDTEAVLGRTVRGLTVLGADENRLENTVLQAGALLLPDVIPDLEGGANPVNTNINRNLFLAANNTRLPASSFTIYSAGIGRAESLTPEITELSEIPPANYNSIWLGISPVIERNLEPGETFYQPTGAPRTVARGAGEGGADTNVQFISAVNGINFSTANLQDYYTQIYLNIFNTDVNLIGESIYREETVYYPHLSLTGNLTNTQEAVRYYAGAIASEEFKAYLGGDYTNNTIGGWIFQAGGIGYLNPDRDYYSQLWATVSKNISLGEDANLILTTDLNYALDRESRIGNVVSDSPASTVEASARLNWKIVSFRLTNSFGDILPNSY
ncbi:MAG: hypothetical protein VKK42_28380 [Lyngbya sp.]|nr:hypothetical protein [Lyngbya sp.]